MRSRKLVKREPFWPELPCGRAEIDRVQDLLIDWAGLSNIAPIDQSEEQYKSLFLNSTLHILECALVMYLHRYAHRRTTDSSDIFRKNGNLSNSLEDRVFQSGYPDEMARSLELCYELEAPWELSESDALDYVDQLVRLIKDIALYQVEPSTYWQDRASEIQRESDVHLSHSKKFKGRKPNSLGQVKKFIAEKIDYLNGSSAMTQWGELKMALSNLEAGESAPLWLDDSSDVSIVRRTGGDTVYGFKLFEQHRSALRNPKK